MDEQIPFIRREATTNIYTAINRALKSRSIITIGANRGCGLSRLLRQWVLAEPKCVQQDQVSLVSLMDPEQATFRNIKFMTPAAHLMVWETCHALHRLAKVQHGGRYHVVLPSGGSDYSGSRFLQLCTELRTLPSRLQLRALVIDNAQHVDEQGLRKLLEARDVSERSFALVLGYQMQTHAKPDEFIVPLLKNVHAFDQRTDAMALERIDEQEFYETVLPELYLALGAEFSSAIENRFDEFQARIWHHTQGNWRLIERLMTIFDQELGPSGGMDRVITAEVEQRVYQRLDAVA